MLFKINICIIFHVLILTIILKFSDTTIYGMKLLTTKMKSYNYTFLFYRQGLTRFEFMLHHTLLLFIKYLSSRALSLSPCIIFFTLSHSYKNKDREMNG